MSNEEVERWVDRVGLMFEEKAYGVTMVSREDGALRIVLFFAKFENTWNFYEALIHEITHIKLVEWKERRVSTDEVEFETYFIQSMFRNIRKIIYNDYETKQKTIKTKPSHKK